MGNKTRRYPYSPPPSRTLPSNFVRPWAEMTYTKTRGCRPPSETHGILFPEDQMPSRLVPIFFHYVSIMLWLRIGKRYRYSCWDNGDCLKAGPNSIGEKVDSDIETVDISRSLVLVGSRLFHDLALFLTPILCCESSSRSTASYEIINLRSRPILCL